MAECTPEEIAEQIAYCAKNGITINEAQAVILLEAQAFEDAQLFQFLDLLRETNG